MYQSLAEIRAAAAALHATKQQEPERVSEPAPVPQEQPEKIRKVALTAEQIERLEAAKNSIVGYCPDLTVIRAGAWLWATGNTKLHRLELQRQGWFFASKKCAWYYHLPEHHNRRKRGGEMPLERILDKYATTEHEHAA